MGILRSGPALRLRANAVSGAVSKISSNYNATLVGWFLRFGDTVNPRRQRAIARKQLEDVKRNPFTSPHTMFATLSDFKAEEQSIQGSTTLGSRSRYKRHQHVVIAAWGQPSSDWREWRKRTISLQKARMRFDAGELVVQTRSIGSGQVVTFMQEAYETVPGEATPQLLDQDHIEAMGFSVTATVKPALECFERTYREVLREERVIAQPFVGANPALTIYASVGSRDVTRWKQLKKRIDRRPREFKQRPNVGVLRVEEQAA